MDKMIGIPVTWVEKFLDIYESLSERPNRKQDLDKLIDELHVMLVQDMRKLNNITIDNIQINTTKVDMQDLVRWVANEIKNKNALKRIGSEDISFR